MTTDIFLELVQIFDSLINSVPHIQEFINFYPDLIGYINGFLAIIGKIYYFVPRVHFLTIVSFSLIGLSIRSAIGLYNLLPVIRG